jgi:hypothetical protein
MDPKDWNLVYETNDKFDAELIQAHLREMDIEAYVFDHQASMFKSLNQTNYAVGVYVHPENVDKAKAYIEEHNKKS